MADVTASERPAEPRAMADHHLRLPDRGADLRAALGDGLLPAADAGRQRLGPPDLRPRHGAAEPVLGPRPAVLRGHRRQIRHLARAGHRRRHLCRRPLSDGDRRIAARCSISAAACWSGLASRPARSASCSPPSPGTRPPERRSIVFGIGTAAGSAGMFLFAPISQGLIDAYGWSDCAGLSSASPMLVVAAPCHPAARQFAQRQQDGDGRDAAVGRRSAARSASATAAIVLLTTGFFVCGFQVAFITAHFPAYIARHRHRRRAMR